MLRIFIQRANDQKCLNVLSIEMFFEIKQERKKKRNTQVQLCGLGHYLQKPPMKLTPAYKFGFPFLSCLWPVILTSQAIQVSTLLGVCRWLQRSMYVTFVNSYRETFCTEKCEENYSRNNVSEHLTSVYLSRMKQAHKNGNEWALLC